jgi:hypothetical protein
MEASNIKTKSSAATLKETVWHVETLNKDDTTIIHEYTRDKKVLILALIVEL